MLNLYLRFSTEVSHCFNHFDVIRMCWRRNQDRIRTLPKSIRYVRTYRRLRVGMHRGGQVGTYYN